MSFNCSVDSYTYNAIENLFSTNQLRSECVDFIRYVLTLLKIDGFTYSYGGAAYHECAKADKVPYGDRGMAFVIISDRWADLPGAEVQIYSSNTRDKSSHRAHIESVFYANAKVLRDDYMTYKEYGTEFARALFFDLVKKRFPDYIENYPYLYIYDVEPQNCRRGTECVKVTVGYYDKVVIDWKYDLTLGLTGAEMPKVDISSAQYPQKISAKSPPLGKENLHWADLNGHSTLFDIKGWMWDNLYNCGPKEFVGPAGMLQ